MTDLMVGMTIQTEAGPFSRWTDAVLAVLMDTGNYKVNWQMGQPLVWGNPESIDGNTITNFAIGPPQNVFPKYYMRDFSVQEIWYASFDFKFSGPFSGPAHIRASYSEKQFYDPKGIGVGTTQVYDFIPFYFPNYVCPKGQAILPSTMSYFHHKCGTYTCDGYKSFTIQVNKDLAATQFESVTCTKDNATKEFSLPLGYYSRKVSCVDPERFCRSVKLNEMKFVVDPFNPDTRQLNSDSPTPTQPEPDNNPSGPEPGNNPSGPEPGNNPSGPEPGNNPSGPEPGNNPSGPEPGNNPSGPEPGNNPSGPEPGNNPSGPEPGNNPSGPEPGNNPSGPEPGNNPSGPEPGNNPSGPEPGNNPSGPEPGNNPSGPEPGNNPSGPEPGNNPSGPEPGNNPSGPGVENPSGTGGNETTTTGSGGSYENSKAAEKKAKKKKLIIIAACAGVAALIVIAFIAALVIFAIRNAKENAYHEDSDANYVV
ncbi:hypothetical protein TVAG_473690 [Trichomonas vaginalis G3]|uniref:Uncharacterized protein n=1 Tax=Trichomonas vaginalis (strain ATCC PRA-98 / G3) TaxID=412133 RepID=A2GTC2_TRIV3|nr:hypothetical protein TVAG_473690 [Trichomonas vaginalis G3]|eukprot:XP_001292525.1 hypothetical protein [Trichomonas vaginalis G3]